MDRRKFLAATLTTGTALSVASTTAPAQDQRSVKILGVSCSPRRGKTTATAVKAALDAAGAVDRRIKTELLDLGGLQIAGHPGPAPQAADDFERILPKLKDPDLAGIIIGSPSYFRSMSALCKAFLERLAVLRKPILLLADKPVGALAVGAFRNGGQELVIEQIQTAMLCHQTAVLGGKPPAFQGATLWNNADDDITKDELGMNTARQLGIRVAEATLRLAAVGD